MTNANQLKTLKLANILKKVGKMKVQGYESTIAMPPENSFTRLLRTMKAEQEREKLRLWKI